MKSKLVWQEQEPAFDAPESCWRFRLDNCKHVVSTADALAEFGREQITAVLVFLQQKAEEHNGLDYLQTFKNDAGCRLWVIENEEAITALLPSDY